MTESTHEDADFDSHEALWILGGLTFASVLVCIISNILLFKTCLDANQNIHNNMLVRLLKAPLRFFEINPSGRSSRVIFQLKSNVDLHILLICKGRILNRFSKDVGAVDESLPVSMLQTVQWCSIVLGNLLQVLIVNWLTAFPLLIILFLYARIKDIYLTTAQNIKRLEGIGKVDGCYIW